MKFFDDLFKNLEISNITGFNNELKSLYSYNKYKKEKKSILLVTSNINDAGKLYNSIKCYTDNVWLFPMDDFLTSEALAVSPEFKITRLETLNCILKNKGIIITNLMGYLRYLPPKDTFVKRKITLKKGREYNFDDLIEKLYMCGYKREITVNMTGDMAIRGYVLDIFPINYDNPIRIEFWGDEIESIRVFNVDNQLTIEKIEEVFIFPNTEYLVEKENIDKPYRFLGTKDDTVNINGYLNECIVIYDNLNALKINYEFLVKEMLEYSISVGLDSNTKYMFDFRQLEALNPIVFEDINDNSSGVTFNKTQVPYFNGNIDYINKMLNKYLNENKTVIICLDSRYKINKILDYFQNDLFIYTTENEIFINKVNIINKNISSGFCYMNYIIITENELYGKKEENKYKTKFKYGTRIKDITKLEIGDYVVHSTQGIGKYLGLKTIVKKRLKKDYLTIEYAYGDKLYIPVEKIELISKYSGKDSVVKLNKLGSTQWLKTKERARKRAESIAEELLELYAIRESKKGFSFNKDDNEQIAFEKEFKYQETKDQFRVIEEIKKDMESEKPMDRLLCGDVGYGKTEVAFRAIFKSILSGKQAALLCPTTILSSQHYQNAVERFKLFGVNIALLNRFIKKKDVLETLKKLKCGQIDFLIGTHRILSDDVQFKDLGLLVIDEEQRFGVKHKEKIKTYKNNVDVLTLSATPIPRTLQMSMAGIRNLSLIETPPVNRYPIQTYVLAENSQIIKDAIYKEISRGGQVFVLYNSVENMAEKLNELKNLVPDVKIAVAHGQMNKEELENVMLDFIDKKYDVLLCTTIIETGIDISNANTLIIIDSDKLGLSQLYQIRGRIGRNNKIAYCYLMYNNKKILSEIAVKRLNTIKDFTELGSGFAIAMRDLSIRGAGDILGSEQAGFIDSIGIELFLEMLNEEILKLQGKEPIKKEETAIPLIEVETYIDDRYVDDEDLKIEIHKKINTIDSYESLNKVKEELEDRFGKITDELIIYMHEELFEKYAKKLNIDTIKQTKNFVEITLSEDLTNSIDGDVLFYEVTKISRMFKFGMKLGKLKITLDTIKLDKHFIYYLIELLKLIDENIK